MAGSGSPEECREYLLLLENRRDWLLLGMTLRLPLHGIKQQNRGALWRLSVPVPVIRS